MRIRMSMNIKRNNFVVLVIFETQYWNCQNFDVRLESVIF